MINSAGGIKAAPASGPPPTPSPPPPSRSSSLLALQTGQLPARLRDPPRQVMKEKGKSERGKHLVLTIGTKPDAPRSVSVAFPPSLRIRFLFPQAAFAFVLLGAISFPLFPCHVNSPETPRHLVWNRIKLPSVRKSAGKKERDEMLKEKKGWRH